MGVMQMENSIIKEEELIKLSSGIKLVKAHIKVSGSYAMLDLSPFEFLNFCKANNIQTNLILCRIVQFGAKFHHLRLLP